MEKSGFRVVALPMGETPIIRLKITGGDNDAEILLSQFNARQLIAELHAAAGVIEAEYRRRREDRLLVANRVARENGQVEELHADPYGPRGDL